MKVASKRNKTNVGCSMRRLRRALETVTTLKIADEIAFHLAEVKPELCQLVDLLNDIERHLTISPSALSSVLYFVDVHWHYHFSELRKLMKTRSIVHYAEAAVASPKKRSRSPGVSPHRAVKRPEAVGS